MAFFAAMVAYVRWCDRIVGPELSPTVDTATAGHASEAEVPA